MFRRTQSCLEVASGEEIEAVTFRPKSPGSGVFTTTTEEDVGNDCGLDPPLDVEGPQLFSLRSVMDEDVLRTEFSEWASNWRSECKPPPLTTAWHGEINGDES